MDTHDRNMQPIKLMLVIVVLLVWLTGCGSGYSQISIDSSTSGQSIEEYVESQDFSGSILIMEYGKTILNKGFD